MPPEQRPLTADPPTSPERRSPIEVAKDAVTRRAEPVLGDPTRVKFNVTVALSREAAERLMARSIERDYTTFGTMLGEILEAAAREMQTDRPSRRLGSDPPRWE